MYRDNQMVQDVQDQINTTERRIADLREAPLCDVTEFIDNVAEAVSDIEHELRYVDDELTEKQEIIDEWDELISEYDCVDDVPMLTEDESEEYAKLKANAAFIEAEKGEMEHIIEERDYLRTKVRNLEFFFENQRRIINALLDRMREVNTLSDGIDSLTAQSSIDKLIAEVSQKGRIEDQS